MLDYSDRILRNLMEQGNFGLERESMRVDEKGYLAETPHPFPVDGIIDRDFCESQIEIITPVCDSTASVYQSLKSIHEYVADELRQQENGPEYLWLFSNPPYVREGHIPIAHFPEELAQKNIYREYLAGKYGKQMMLYSGIHYNFSFAEAFLARAWELTGRAQAEAEFRKQFYLELSAQVLKHSWLIVLLTAASPVFDLSLRYKSILGIDGFQNIASMRNSDHGYWNRFVPVLDYSSMDTYIGSIERYVREGILYAPAELYLPVRIKPRGENKLEQFHTDGVSHIELRMLDLNPLAEIGIEKKDLDFLHYLLIWLSSLEPNGFSEEEQKEAVANHKLAAGYDVGHINITRNGQSVSILAEAERILKQMQSFFRTHNCIKGAAAVKYQLDKIQDPGKRYAVQVYQRYQRHYVEKGMQRLHQGNMVKAAEVMTV